MGKITRRAQLEDESSVKEASRTISSPLALKFPDRFFRGKLSLADRGPTVLQGGE